MSSDLKTEQELAEEKTSSVETPTRAAIRRVDSWMRIKYGIGLDTMEIAETPGYWRDKEPRIHDGHPLHGCLGCSGAFKATYTYFDNLRENGRFVSPTKSWRIIRDGETEQGKAE